MQFRYPAQLQPDGSGAVVVSFRDLPECFTSGADEAEALKEAGDALEEAILYDAKTAILKHRIQVACERAGVAFYSVP